MTLIAGFGYRAAATAASMEDALARALAAAGDAAGGASGAAIFSAPADKISAPCARDFAAARGVEITPIDAAILCLFNTPTQAPRVIEKRGVGSVAEAVAMAAAGMGGELIVPRTVSEDRMATCALVKV